MVIQFLPSDRQTFLIRIRKTFDKAGKHKGEPFISE